MITARLGNIFAPTAATGAELFETLLERPGMRMERIVSTGQSTPPGEWYDQSHDEWVLLLTGSACLQIEGESTPLLLRPGDYLLLPARCRHRVEWTEQNATTVWLACHLHSRKTGE